MNYHNYYPVDVINGPGTRCTLFVAGCEHHCDGCYNASTWSPESGHPFDDALAERMQWILEHADEATVAGQRAEETARKYDWNIIADQTEQVYAQALRG